MALYLPDHISKSFTRNPIHDTLVQGYRPRTSRHLHKVKDLLKILRLKKSWQVQLQSLGQQGIAICFSYFRTSHL